MDNVIKFRGKPPKPDGIGDQETIGSRLRRKRYMEGPPKPPNKRRGNITMRRALKAIEADAQTIDSCLRWLRHVAESDHDPRALVAMMEERFTSDDFQDLNTLNSWEDCGRLLAMIESVIVEYRKQFKAPPPRLVK